LPGAIVSLFRPGAFSALPRDCPGALSELPFDPVWPGDWPLLPSFPLPSFPLPLPFDPVCPGPFPELPGSELVWPGAFSEFPGPVGE
jgi:hypothetical protein